MPFDGSTHRKPPTARLIAEMTRLIETRGWIQGCYASDQGFCLIGALDEAKRAIEPDAETRQDALNALYKACDWKLPMEFNDAEGRTREQVLDMLAKAEAHAMETTPD